MVTHNPTPGTLGYKLRTATWNAAYRWSKQMLEGHGHASIRMRWRTKGDLFDIQALRDIIRDAIDPGNTNEES